MRGLILFLTVFLAMPGYADGPVNYRLSAVPEWVELGKYKERIQPIKLKSGAYLFINDNGTMNMMDASGKPVMMNDGIGMRLLNGSLITMQGDPIQRLD